MTITSFGSNVVTFIIPFFVALLAPDDLQKQVSYTRLYTGNLPVQWSLIFYLIAGLMFACTAFFDLTARAEPRPWTQDESADEEGCEVNSNNVSSTVVRF